MSRKTLAALLVFAFAAGICYGEIIELIDGTKISGKLTHAYGPVLEVKCEGGEVLVLQLEKVKSISYVPVKPHSAFATPEKAFMHYLDLAREGKIEETVGCYRLMYQKMMAEQVAGMSDADKAMLQENMVKTEFEIGTPVITGGKAKLPVKQKSEKGEEEAEIVLVKEDGEWKLAMTFLPEEPDKVQENVIVVLRDGTEVKGELLHVYSKAVEVKGKNGELIELETGNVKEINVILAGPRPQYQTPEKAFSYYLSLLKQGKIEDTVDCYRLMLQTVIAAQVADMSVDDKRAMQKETVDTKFEYGKAEIKGDTATLKVTRVSGKSRDTADVIFVKENGEWKLTMPDTGQGPSNQ